MTDRALGLKSFELLLAIEKRVQPPPKSYVANATVLVNHDFAMWVGSQKQLLTLTQAGHEYLNALRTRQPRGRLRP